MCPPTTKHNDPNHLKNTTSNNIEKEEEDELQTTIRGTNINDVAIEKPVPFTKLIGLAYPERYMLFFALLCMIVAEGLALINPLVIANAYDALVNPSWTNAQRMSQINHTMIYVLVIHTTAIVFQYIRSSIMGTAGVRIVARTRNRLYQSILRQEIAFFDVTKTGELTSRLGSDTGLLEEGISSALPEVMIGLIVVVVSLVIMFWISWKLALMMMGFLAVTLMLSVPFGNLLGKLSKSYQDYLGLAQTHSTEALGAIRTVQSFAAEDKELHRYTSNIGRPEQYTFWWPTDHKTHPTTYSYGFFKSLTQIALFIIIFGIGFGALYVVLWYGLKLVIDGELTLGQLTAFQTYIFQVGGKLGQTSQFIAKLYETQGAASRIFYLMERIPAIPTPSPTNGNNNIKNDDDNTPADHDFEKPDTPLTLSTVKGAVDFNNVSFAYPTRPNLTVLQNFSLSIAPNQTAALVGASGAGTSFFSHFYFTVFYHLHRTRVCYSNAHQQNVFFPIILGNSTGKSTVVGLLQRFYDVSAGSVTLDGYDIRKMDMNWLRSQMAYVQQEPQLFGLTIRENIMYGVHRDNVTQEEIETVAKEANAHDFICQFPDGYDTLVGERGIQLSGGQKQRIAIARALLPRPQLLLLDEATSALDAESEHLVQEAIDKAVVGRTVIIVAHRLSTVQRADKIVVIDDHQIVDAGTHGELLSRCTKYQDLIKRQALIGSNGTDGSNGDDENTVPADATQQ